MLDGQNDIDKDGDIAIQITGLHKFYPVFPSARHRLRYLNASIFGSTEEALESCEKVHAINGLSLIVRRGERVGIIGRNGAGKSTLLKLLAGGFKPNKGSIEINGEIYSLMPGNVVFSREMSAHDNARNYLAQFGFEEDVITRKVREIEDFVELGNYFHQPIKNYSLGMRVRTEFAVATCLDAEILIIDEVLGAGDTYWTAKCAQRMEELCMQGRTLLFVSHALDQVMKFCERCVWIDQGNVVMHGSSFEVSRRYEGFLERLTWHTGDVEDKQAVLDEIVPNLGDVILPASGQNVVRWPGLGDVEFSGIWVNEQGVNRLEIPQGSPLVFGFELTPTSKGPQSLRLVVTFWDNDGKRVATIENTRLTLETRAGVPYSTTVSLDSGQIGAQSYSLTFSLFSLQSGQGTGDELTARQDVIYKSIELTVRAPEKARFDSAYLFSALFEDDSASDPETEKKTS